MNFRLSTTCSNTVAALHCYLKRLAVSLIIVPSAVACLGFALVSNFSFNGMGIQLAQFVADHGTGNSDTLRQSRCVDHLRDLPSSNAHPTPICRVWASEDISVKSFGNELGRALSIFYFLIALPAALLIFLNSADSPLALRHRIGSRINEWTERHTQLWLEKRRQRTHH